MFKSFLLSLKGIKHERVRYSVACSTSSTISEGLNEYFKIKKLHLFAFSRNACFHQRPLKQFWLKRNHSQVDRVDTSSSASSLKSTFLLYEKSFIRCKMQILLLVFGREETSCLKAWQLFFLPWREYYLFESHQFTMKQRGTVWRSRSLTRFLSNFFVLLNFYKLLVSFFLENKNLFNRGYFCNFFFSFLIHAFISCKS